MPSDSENMHVLYVWRLILTARGATGHSGSIFSKYHKFSPKKTGFMGFMLLLLWKNFAKDSRILLF
jgi:hypothetical protein